MTEKRDFQKDREALERATTLDYTLGIFDEAARAECFVALPRYMDRTETAEAALERAIELLIKHHDAYGTPCPPDHPGKYVCDGDCESHFRDYLTKKEGEGK